MFTSIDKALVSAVMVVVFFVAKYWPPVADIVTPDIANMIVAAIVPLVWATPNKIKP